MLEDRRSPFSTQRFIRYHPGTDAANCQKVHLADIDGNGKPEIIIIRSDFSKAGHAGAIAVYDLDLKMRATSRWNGMATDVVAADIDGDGINEIIVTGKMMDSTAFIKIYRYDEYYRGNLQLLSQNPWKTPKEVFGIATDVCVFALDNDSRMKIAVLTIVEGSDENAGYGQIRIYGADMQLESIAKWTPPGGNILRTGHNMATADIDDDGYDELIAIASFQSNGVQKTDLRVFDHHLLTKRKRELVADMALSETRMSIGDIDGDGKMEIVVSGNKVDTVSECAISQLLVFDSKLNLKNRTSWKTFRHSWVWDFQIADVDGDGKQEIIAYGGTSMSGRDQEDANIMGEVRLFNGSDLTPKDMFIWQSRIGEDTRPSRGFVLKDDGQVRLIVTTSRWSRSQKTPELEMRILGYKPITGAMSQYSEFIKAYSERDVEALKAFAQPEDGIFAFIALEALSVYEDDAAIKAVGQFLKTRNRPLFLHTVELLRGIWSDRAIDSLRAVGFTTIDDWAVIGPFDNVNNGGFDTKYPPEQEIDLNAFYAGKDKIVRWGKVEKSKPDIKADVYIDLAQFHFEAFERTGIELNWNSWRTEAVMYALTNVLSPAKMKAQLRIGKTDGIKVWLDGDLKYGSYMAGKAVVDHGIAPVSLAKGRNRVLLKIANYKTEGWGFFLRVTDDEGRPIPDLSYEPPATQHVHNQMLTVGQLLPLLDHQDKCMRYLAASQLALSGDKRGNESLAALLQAGHMDMRAKAALVMVLARDRRGLNPLVKLAQNQDYLFQINAGYALERFGDNRSEQFSISDLKDRQGKEISDLELESKEDGFYISLMFSGEKAAHANVGTNRRLHLGDNVFARYARILSFGIREPKYRGSGMGSIVLKRACDIMAEMGHSCSVLSTGTRLIAHRLYCGNGYVDRRFPWEYVKELKGNHTVAKSGEVKIRDYSDADAAAMNSLRKEYGLNTVGPASWLPRSDFDPSIKIAENAGRVLGYTDVYLDPFESVASVRLLYVNESFCNEQAAARALLSAIHRYAMAEGKEKIIFRDPPLHYRDILLESGYRIDPDCIRYGWVNMLKIIDLVGFLRDISHLLHLRLEKSRHAGWCGSIGIKGAQLEAALAVDSNGNMNVENKAKSADILISTDDAVITNLVSGGGNIWEVYRQGRLGVNPIFNERIRGLIEALFPSMRLRQGYWW